MEIRVLGPVDAVDGGQHVPLGGPRARTVVATLALAGDALPVDQLVEEVWSGTPPRSAVGTLHSYVSRLRRSIGGQRLVNGGGSYRLLLDEQMLDADRFRSQLEVARAAADAGHLDAAEAAYASALGRWRGEVAAGLDAGPIVRAAAVRLSEQRLVAIEERIDVALAAGRHREVVPDLDALTADHPHRERLHAQRMLALYRAGRQVDALVGFRIAREQLVEGLGLEPGPQLQELQQRILAQDPGLELLAEGNGWTDPSERPGAAHARPVSSSAAATPRSSRARARRRRRLPAPLDTFVGRRAQRAEVAQLLGQTRLVTLVGAGGCGKTQLALRVATDLQERYPDGIWWVELGAQRDPALVARAVGAAIGLPAPTDGTWTEAVLDGLTAGEQLLVLDNCEHLVEPCAELVATLLRHSPSLHVLATSREPLDVAGERAWRVPSLALPPADGSAQAILASEAAQLLAVRATAVRPGFQLADEDPRTVAAVCRELDGIPLAIELAAARLAVLSIDELAERLEDRFRVLTGGRRSAPARHRTLEAAIGWSYDLLDADERALLTRLSVFAGGFTTSDVEAVCAYGDLRRSVVLDTMCALVDKSLVQPVRAPAGPARHDLLTTVRSFADARLDDHQVATLRRRHAEHYAAIAVAAGQQLTGFDQVAWLNRLHAEQDNLRQVLDVGGEPAALVASWVWIFWLEFGHAREGDRWIREVLASPGTQDPAVLLRLHEGAARLAAAVRDHDRVLASLAAAEVYADRVGDHAAALRCAALRASEAAEGGDLDTATASLEIAAELANSHVDAWTVASLAQARARVATRQGAVDRAAAAYAEAERSFQLAGDEWGACLARLGAARLARRTGDAATAVRHHRTNLARGLDLTVSSLDFVGLPQDLHGLSLLASDEGQHELAMTLVGAASAVLTAVEIGEDDESADRDRVRRRAIAQIGEQETERALERGRAGDAEAAVQLALERTSGLCLVGG